MSLKKRTEFEIISRCKIISIILCTVLILSAAAYAADISAVNIEKTAEYIMTAVENPVISSVGGEWTIIGLARSGLDIPQSYFDKYYQNVRACLNEKNGILHSAKNTEYSRVIIALTAIGKNPENVDGCNLITPLYDTEKTMRQGLNGPVWALIALDCGSYGSAAIREEYIAKILEREKEGGGWSLSETSENAEIDITAMTVTALARYCGREDVSSAVMRAVSFLSEKQNENGGYTSYGSDTSESTAQVLCALSALGASAEDSRFVKNNKSLIDNILSFSISDGSFSHTSNKSEANLMATEQCFYSLVAAKRLENGMTSLFDMSDVKRNNTEAGEAGAYTEKSPVKVPSVKYSEKSFDDIGESKNAEAIKKLAERGILSGKEKNMFFPYDTVTRAEFSAIAVRALGLEAEPCKSFSDVEESDWYFEYVGAANRYGIVNGVSETEFNPDGIITVEEALTMLERCAGICGMANKLNEDSVRNVLAEFTDYITLSDWARAGAAFCYENGIADRSETEIKPNEAVTREKTAQLLYNLLMEAGII